MDTLEMGVNGPVVSTTCSPCNVEHTICVRLFWDTRTGAEVERDGGRERTVDGTVDEVSREDILET